LMNASSGEVQPACPPVAQRRGAARPKCSSMIRPVLLSELAEADVTFAGLAGVVPGLLAWQNLGEAMRTIVVAGTHLYYYYYYYYY